MQLKSFNVFLKNKTIKMKVFIMMIFNVNKFIHIYLSSILLEANTLESVPGTNQY
jgi:hypothetical protein